MACVKPPSTLYGIDAHSVLLSDTRHRARHPKKGRGVPVEGKGVEGRFSIDISQSDSNGSTGPARR